MSDSKHAPEKWRAEELRAQRKARLAQMKSKDGGKKPIQTRNPINWIVLSVILVIILGSTSIWAVIRFGVPHRNLTALTVGSEKVKVVELNYYYRYLLSNYGIDPSTDDGKETLQGASGIEGFPTVADYIKDIAAQTVQENAMLADNAKKEGIALDENDYSNLNKYMEYYKSAAQQEGSDIGNYLVSLYGNGMTLTELQKIFERQFLADKFVEAKQKSLNFTEEEITAYYENNKDTYDVVDYRIFTINSTAETDATDAEKTKALEEARTQANEMLSKITDEASFKELCIEYAAEKDKDAYQSDDKSLNESVSKSTLSSTNATWLFDAARKPGDKTVVDATNGYTILYFIKRSRPDYQHIAVRHILVAADESSATEEELAAAKTKAESILAEYLGGEQTEESFSELARVNSEDNAADGGLYDDVSPGEMVDSFNDWCFDENRKTGDTDIVQTEFGYHVMYFVGFAGAEWEINVISQLRNDAYNEFVENEIQNYPYKLNKFALKFVA